MVLTAVIFMVIFFVIGMPISFAVGLASILGILISGHGVMPGFIMAQQMTGDLNSFTLLAIPLFMLAGNIMEKADISRRIMQFCSTTFSWLRGGVGIVCVVANMIFAGITGSGYASITSIGQLTIPNFEKSGYKKGFFTALIAGGGGLGPVIPPSNTMIVYGLVTGMSVGRLFIGGIGPGILIGLGLCITCFVYAKIHNIDYGGSKFSFKAFVRDFGRAFFALMMPVIMIGGVLGGVFTATEAGVVACVYGLICGLVIYRTMKLRDIIDICFKTAASAGMLLTVLATTGLLTFMFARSGTGVAVGNFLNQLPGVGNKYILYTIMMLFFFIVGIPLEVTPILRILMPLIYPTILASGMDPMVFGISAVIFAVIGNLSPPVGNYIFMAMKVADCSYKEIEKPMWLVTVIFIGVVLIAGYLLPGIITFLPNTFMGPM